MSEAENLKQSLIEAMNVIASAGDGSLQFDRTIICTVVAPVDAATGEYKVRYLDQAFSAYDTSLGMKYKVNSAVYVQIPQNDMSAKKIILGKKSTKASDLGETTLTYEKVNKVGLPLEDIYNIDLPTRGLMGSVQHGTHKIQLYSHTENNNLDTIFQQYAKERSALMISAGFKTSWCTNSNIYGNYGIEVVFKTVDQKLQSYILDISRMTGNPMNYLNFNSNYQLFSIDGSILQNLEAIYFFAEDFKRDDGYTEQILLTRWDNGDAEIFVDDVSISFVEKIQETGYSLNIVTPQGIFFQKPDGSTYRDNLTLEAQLKYNGSTDNIDITKANIYWFEQDTSISIAHEDFDELGGVGWKRIASRVISTAIPYQNLVLAKKYKCVAIYEEHKLQQEITLYKNYKQEDIYEINLKRDVDGVGQLVFERKDKNQIPNDYTFSWMSIDINGSTQVEDSNSNILDIDVSNILQSRTYYCTLYNNGIAIITLAKTIQNQVMERQFDVDFITDNNGVFTYDEAGDLYSPVLNESPNLIYNLDFNIRWQTEEDKERYTYEWILPEDTSQYMFTVPANNKLTGDYKEKDKSITYLVRKRFDYPKSSNNIIRLRITIQGYVYEFEKELSFIKEGDPGTNGTSLVMRLMPTKDPSSGILYYALGNQVNDWVCLSIQLFYNGRDSINGYSINDLFTYEASIPRDYRRDNPLYEKVNFSISNHILTVRVANSLVLNGANSIIQVKAKPNKIAEGLGFKYPVYGLYGVPLTDVPGDTYKVLKASGTNYVMYDAAGYNPRFAETPYELKSFAQSVAVNSVGFSLDDENIIVPQAKYDSSYHGGIQFTGPEGIYLYPVIFMMNAYSQEILNAWDGSSVEINEDESYILAAQIGAGSKNAANQFTGVLMGSFVEGNRAGKSGLYGFQDGEATFGFLEDGTAFIGKSSHGRIDLDGNNATIKSGNYSNSSGMKIDLENGLIDAYNFSLNSSYLNIRPNYFNFNSNGDGSFVIRDGSSTLLHFGRSNYIQSYDGSTLEIDLDRGTINCTKVDISGTINADDGQIGPWYINNDGIYNGPMYINANGDINMSGNITLGGNSITIGSAGTGLRIGSAVTAGYALELIGPAIRIASSIGNVYIQNANQYVHLRAGDVDISNLHVTGNTSGIYARFA